MLARNYLQQIEITDIKINHKQKELDDLKLRAISIGSIDYSKDRIQVSPTGSAISNQVAKYVDLSNELTAEIDAFIDMKHHIINEIHQMRNPQHMEVLFKRYVEYKSLEVIAVEMRLSYEWVRHIHQDALSEFQNYLLNNTKQHTTTQNNT